MKPVLIMDIDSANMSTLDSCSYILTHCIMVDNLNEKKYMEDQTANKRNP